MIDNNSQLSSDISVNRRPTLADTNDLFNLNIKEDELHVPQRRGSRFDFASQSNNSSLGLDVNPFNYPLFPPQLPAQLQPRFYPPFDLSQQSQLPQQSQPSLNDLGKGTPLASIPPHTTLFIVEFKATRSDLFYTLDYNVASSIKLSDLVIVEADRGKDLGKVTNDKLTIEDLLNYQKYQADVALSGNSLNRKPSISPLDDAPSPTTSTINLPPPHNDAFEALKSLSKELQPKKIFAKASPSDTQLLITKRQDEAKALQICIQKVTQRNLPMQVIDAEYQWDRRKLTFYFISEQRIDFRELVRELFRGFKTRIWMSNISATASAQLVATLQAQAQAQAQVQSQLPTFINIQDPPSPLTTPTTITHK
ncbi:PSP1-domain-containing protein [Wallemia mellicola CBS 633.66]|nr:PSP1-domain-containing protein [Wallemia mellicola CBS 633.66]TIB74862.1 hypothetical protein E3Q23_02578 [Wallemia mellicola]EIM21802.1 PSP1-domain-containing protein [Wallemia mellicola CBS 633.66]TIB97035.1 PSP1-domain-containing protein [Wallemia mellicola]TIB99538.1 PSP1-domain-containing protein [Wallemia mellicola]TIC10643.1 PSP1-domain-containing protein [Wallemia mellicola]|eukprot:XP_006958106.1 PSP1-domain-containing protein [Wallemia mellicola CBS 633.66]